MSLFRPKLHWRGHHTFSKEKCRLGLPMYCVEIFRIKLPFLEHPFKSNNCITYKHVSSNFLLLLFISVIKASLSQFLNISLPLCFKYKIGASKMIKILEYHNLFYSDVSSFKYNRYWNDILVFTDYSNLSFLILSKNGVPSSSLASRLALTQVFYIFDLLPFLKYESYHHIVIFLK